MKYRLKKDLPGVKAGEIFELDGDNDIWVWVDCGKYTNFYNPQRYPDWFEPVDERIFLRQDHLPSSGYFIQKIEEESNRFTREQLVILEKAINGEMWDEEQIREAFKIHVSKCHDIDKISDWHINYIIEKLKKS